MESNKTAYHTIRYGPFAFALVFIAVPLLGHLYPDSSTFNGQPGPPDAWATAMFVCIGVLIALIPFLYFDKLVVVQMNNQNLKIKKGDKIIEVNWVAGVKYQK